MKPQLVVVTWNDAWEQETDGPHRPLVQRSSGFLVKSDKAGVTLAGCIDESGDIHRRMFIPRGVIVRVQRVK